MLKSALSLPRKQLKKTKKNIMSQKIYQQLEKTQNKKESIFNIIYLLSLPVAIITYIINYL